jgi:hypothetical protein
VQDLDPPVAARDQPVALERPQHDGDGGTLHNVRPMPVGSPKNTPMPSMPSRPTVATSTSGPLRISVVTENTPPFGK